MNKNLLKRKNNMQQEALERERLFASMMQMPDQDFIRALEKLHREFVFMVHDLMRRGHTPDYLFRSIARSVAQTHDYILLCDRIYVPVCFQEKLMGILKAQEDKSNLFDDDKIQEQLDAQNDPEKRGESKV